MYEYSTYVTSVTDGDTFNTATQRVRLANISTPENSTLEGQKSTTYLRLLIEWKRVRIKSVATDTYGHIVAHVWRYSDGLYINRSIVDSGHADWE